MLLGLDYSAGRPGGAAIAATQYGFAARYLDNGLGGRANLTLAEAQDLAAHGIEVVTVWERKLLSGPDRATEGAPAGTVDAQASEVQLAAVGRAGYPNYFAVDFDCPDYAPSSSDPRAKLGPVGDYLAAARDVVGLARMGVYGGYWVVKRALDAGLATFAWQTVAWSGGLVDPRIHLLQRLGTVRVGNVDCDVNEALKNNYGQNVPAVGPHVSTVESDDMGFWVIMRQPDGSGGRRESSGYFDSTSGDLLILSVPDAVREAGAYSDLNAGGASDADALGRWNALAGRWDRNKTAIASAIADALKADGIGSGTSTGGSSPAPAGAFDFAGTITPKTA